MRKSIVIIAGATASGKSAAAVDLAGMLNGEIINADAFQIYQGLKLLTAIPEPSNLPHHLYGFLDPMSDFNAAKYAALVTPLIREIHERDKTPILCGGTGLYIKAITHGLDEAPPANPDLREELSNRPLENLVEELLRVDPEAANTLDLRNPVRVIRALEIYYGTGRPVSEIRKAWKTNPPPDFLGYTILLPREELHRRIKERTRRMFDLGVVDEVAGLPDLTGYPAARALGYAEIRALLSGSLTRAQCETRIVELTRQYARRQETWFRKETWMKPFDANSAGQIG